VVERIRQDNREGPEVESSSLVASIRIVDETSKANVALTSVDIEVSVPNETSEGVESFVDEDFGDSEGATVATGVAKIFVGLLEDGKKGVVRKIEKRSAWGTCFQ